ncbi:hypothetical protein BGW41_005514 [Actinomortierella wolfii]|nr:hypothetical protein BGW41_005514 [Actinomortierella wolfii]
MTHPDLPTPSNPGPFGHVQRKNFLFPEGFTQFNHGSFGTFPKVVEESMQKWHLRAEQDPDRWMRRELKPALEMIRGRLGEFMNCDKDELVMVTNTTVGVNTILRSLNFEPGDYILQLTTSYVSVDRTINYIADTKKDVGIINVPINFPLKDHEIVNRVEQAILEHQAKKDGTRIRLAMVDWISSVPAIVHPVKALTDLLRSYGILVFVDGAHAIGQVPVDLTWLNPDFFITNCHKWLFSVRGSAVLYVPKHHQHLIHPLAITGDYNTGFENEFAWNGTQDYSSLLSVAAAIDFRKQYGEDAIIHYTHTLAVEGGKKIAEILGTNVMTPDDDHQVGNMVNVRLPINNLEHPKIETPQYLIELMQDKYNAFVPCFKHNGAFWCRVSAQIYLEMSDFVRLGNVLKEVIDDLNAEEKSA